MPAATLRAVLADVLCAQAREGRKQAASRWSIAARV